MYSDRSKIALRISLLVSFLSMSIKTGGYLVTGSATALSDALESLVHILAVAFVYYGFVVSMKPADEDHLYGHERIEYLSVGIEGIVIFLAGLSIIYRSVNNYLAEYALEQLTGGILLLSAAAVVNLVLGLYLQHVGRKEDNMIVLSNGKHTLTDVWTSAGAVGTLLVVKFTGWMILDSIVAVLLAGYIMFEGFKLLRYSVEGIMDTRNPGVDRAINRILNDDLPGSMVSFHNLRHRTTGKTTWVELHAVFQEGVSLKQAHHDATVLEKKLINAIKDDVIVTIHLEPEGSHEEAHRILKDADQNRPMRDYI